MRFIAVLLAAGLLWVQAQTWFGQRSAARVTELQQQLQDQEAANTKAREAQTRARAELKDLREGLEMVEEKARLELGMVKPDEIFVKLDGQPSPPASAPSRP
ncbi:septum formation initiator family protein [Inhella proteolytica]|uniref:Cell division protein FtsB n=1 Tax=Inhella proteolytica TaxID=2795029 RepID=A0A931IZ99_9BURK|nr:septum formation initiator family protein [Inhella proteolytica]MBH9575486.1 septum formation initiator family protein [Inhella proteolytica]